MLVGERWREMDYLKAKYLAEKYAELIRPGCTRLEIVGSVKRGDKLEVNDIEYLVIADEKAPRPEFGQKIVHKTVLDKVLYDLCEAGYLKFKMGGDKLKKYELLEAGEINPFHIEIYIVKPETWGIQNVIRTGPSEFSHRFVTNKAYSGLLPDSCEYVRGETQIKRNGKVLTLPEEADALAVLGLGWIDPKDRHRLGFGKREGRE